MDQILDDQALEALKDLVNVDAFFPDYRLYERMSAVEEYCLRELVSLSEQRQGRGTSHHFDVQTHGDQ
jgi:hypothetical protein